MLGARSFSHGVMLALIGTGGMGFIGFLDDYRKLKHSRLGQKNEGLVERYKLIGQVTIGLLLGLIRPTSGTARIFDLDAWRDAPAFHRRLAYVPSEANPWPSLTGGETLEFLGNVHGTVEDT